MKKIILIVSILASTLVASAQNTSLSYIEKFKDNAIRIMHETGVPASIVLAAAMHESACGNSNIAQKLNNQFGVKGGGKNFYYKNNKKVSTQYKKYDSVMDSFQDFADIMTSRKQFCHLTDELTHYDYVGWAKGIQHSGYCSSHKWAAQVLNIIHKYQLNLYDESPADPTQLAANPQ
ncbi:MAG: glucosaminidase domain-containing protein [Mucilaginibacter sp.]